MGKMVVDFSTKSTQGSIFACHLNAMQGMSKECFRDHKKWHREALEKNDLWDDLEFDLEGSECY